MSSWSVNELNPDSQGERIARGAILILAWSLALVACSGSEPEAKVESKAPPEPTSALVPEPTVLAPGVISTSGFELGISFAPDGNTAYFARIGDGFTSSVIVAAQRVDDHWTSPEPVSFAGRYRDLDAFLSADGSKMFFQSDRPLEGSEPKDWDIWVSEKTESGWCEPRNLGVPINTDGVETYPVVVGDDSLYFSSDREGGQGEGDIYRSRLVDGKYLEPENLGPPINTAEFDSNAFVSLDESYLILSSSTLPGHLGNGDLYLSRRLGDGWTELEHLPVVNSSAREFAPSASPDGTTLFFTRDQRDPALGDEFLGDIYRIELTALGIETD